MTKRVLIVVSNLEFGGAQRQIVELVNNVDTSKFSIFICSLSDYIPLAKELNSPQSVKIIKKYFKYDISVIPRLARLLNELKVDIVQSYLFDADIAVRIGGKIAHTPVIINSERNTDYHLKHTQLFAYGATYKFVDAIIANSHAGATFNQKKLGYPPSKYSVVHNGVDTKHFKPVNVDKLKFTLGLTKDNKVIGMFASFKEQKNHPLFFKTAQKILSHIPEARFLLVGDILHGGVHGSAEYANGIDQLIDHLGLRDYCLFLGNRADVRDLYNICDITVLPSLYEGTPNVLLESMACGIPVVATDVADNSLIVQNGKTGYLAPLHDEELLLSLTLRLLTDNDLRNRMSQAAREWIIKEFSAERLAKKMEAIYLQLLKQKRIELTPSKVCDKHDCYSNCQTRPKKIRVAIATHFPDDLGAPHGGVESVSVNLLTALSEHANLDLHVVTFAINTNTTVVIEKVDGFTIHRLHATKGSKLFKALYSDKRVLCSYLKDKIIPDLVHAHDTYGIMLSDIDYPKLLTIHGFIYKDTAFKDNLFSAFRSYLWRYAEVKSWKKYRNIISITPYVRHTIERISQAQIFDIENPVSPSFFKVAKNEQKYVVFCAAEISHRKNTFNLVKALKILIDEGFVIELRLAGAGIQSKYCQLIKKFITCHHLGKHIVFLGEICVKKIIEELSKATVFALVSLEENSPMGVQEAMALGIPVVTSNRCGMPFMIENGKSGFLVDPSDTNNIATALRIILEDDTLRYSMGLRAKAIAKEKYDSLRIANKINLLYSDILDSQ